MRIFHVRHLTNIFTFSHSLFIEDVNLIQYSNYQKKKFNPSSASQIFHNGTIQLQNIK